MRLNPWLNEVNHEREMELLGYFGHADDTQNTVFCLFTPDTPGLAPDSFPKQDSNWFGTRPGKRYNFLPSIVNLSMPDATRLVTERRIAESDGSTPDPKLIERIIWEYRNVLDGDGIAMVMNELAAKYPAKPGSEGGVPHLPVMADLKQAINVAAADTRGAIALVQPDGGDQALEERLARLAFEDGIAGRTYIARLTQEDWAQAQEVGLVKGASLEAGVFFIAPHEFGLEGEVWEEIPASAPEEKLRTDLVAVLDRFRTEWRKLDRKSHVKEGTLCKITWSEYDPDFGDVVRIEGKSKKLGLKTRGEGTAAPAACETPEPAAPAPTGNAN